MELYISVISEIELFGYQNITTEEMLELKAFLSECQIIPLHNEIKDSCIELKQKHKIKTPDASYSRLNCKFFKLALVDC